MSTNISARKLIFYYIFWFLARPSGKSKDRLLIERVSNSLFYRVLKIKQFYLSSSSQTFQKKQGRTNIREGTNILKSSSCILVLCYLLWKIKYCHYIRNFKLLLCLTFKINQLNISSATSGSH